MEGIVEQNDCFAIGVSALKDENQNAGLSNTLLSISFAFHKALDNEGLHQLSLGIQTTFIRKRLTPPTIFFESQLTSWLGDGYSFYDVSQLKKINVSLLDLQTGIIYQGKINNSTLISTGIALFHITEPSTKFQGGTLKLYPQYWSHLGYQKRISKKTTIYSCLLIGNSKEKVNDVRTGLIYEYKLPKKLNDILFGGWFRNSNSQYTFSPVCGLRYNDFKLFLAYDIHLSNNQISEKSSLELSLGYFKALTRAKFLENKFIMC